VRLVPVSRLSTVSSRAFQVTGLQSADLEWAHCWMCQRGLLTRWVSWCTAVFMVRHLGTSPTISPRPPTSLLGFVCVLQTVTSSLYLTVVSTHMAVGRFRSTVRRSGTRCLTRSEIRRVVLTVLSSFLGQSCLVFTNVTSALVFLILCAI